MSLAHAIKPMPNTVQDNNIIAALGSTVNCYINQYIMLQTIIHLYRTASQLLHGSAKHVSQWKPFEPTRFQNVASDTT